MRWKWTKIRDLSLWIDIWRFFTSFVAEENPLKYCFRGVRKENSLVISIEAKLAFYDMRLERNWCGFCSNRRTFLEQHHLRNGPRIVSKGTTIKVLPLIIWDVMSNITKARRVFGWGLFEHGKSFWLNQEVKIIFSLKMRNGRTALGLFPRIFLPCVNQALTAKKFGAVKGNFHQNRVGEKIANFWDSLFSSSKQFLDRLADFYRVGSKNA